MQIKSTFYPVEYGDLNARAKENYNFHQIAAKLAEYGFAGMRLSDDYGGADFLSIHNDPNKAAIVLKVQLKGRLTFDKKYIDKDIFIAFRENDRVYVYPHDELKNRIQEAEKSRSTKHSEWWDHGSRSWPSIPKFQQHILDEYEI
jgi:hypothetical protein